MKLSPKAKKWGKRILILLLIRLVVGAVLYYIIVYRFKDVIQVVVKKESHGAYAFDASDVTMSLWKRKLVLHNATLTCKDTLNATSHYEVRVPEVYLSIASWTDLLFHKKVAIDSLAIVTPHVYTHQHQRHEKKQVSFHASEILSGLQKALKHLQVKSFTLQKGAFTYGNVFDTGEFKSHNIDFTIRNFSQNNEKNLLAADDVELKLPNQHWTLPSGKAEISFSQLHFSGASQTFTLDSCTFRSLDNEKPKVEISADKIYFNSKQLTDIYEKEELVIDTLSLQHPVVRLQTHDHRQAKDSAHLSSAFEKIFEGIQFRFVDVREGQLELPSYTSERVNLKLFNLFVKPKTKQLATDSIQLSLHNIRLVTRDSLFEMKVKDFSFRQNDLLFHEVSYGPTPINHNPEGITFETPLLEMKNIDMESLLRKKLRGPEAILHRPSITVYKKTHGKNKFHKKTQDHFYETLHGVGELIAVDDFRIVDGDLHYKIHGSSETKMEMKQINAGILLNRFLASDSLIDIKRAMPDLRVRVMQLQSPKLQLQVNDYHFEGMERHNASSSFHLSLAGGTILSGRKLYWHAFDWDMFKNHGNILIDSIDIQELDVKTEKHEPHKKREAKDLPITYIRCVKVKKLVYDQPGGLSFIAKNIRVEDIDAVKKHFTWKHAVAQLSDIVFTGRNVHASIDQVDFNNHTESVLQRTTIAAGTTKINAPLITLKTSLHSTDFSALRIHSLMVEKPGIEINHTASPATAKGEMPLDLQLDRLTIKDGQLKYKSEKDSLSLAAVLNFTSSDLHTSKTNNTLRFDAADISLSNLVFRKKAMEIDLPNTTWALKNGSLNDGAVFKTAIAGNWKGLVAKTELKGSTRLAIENLTGNFEKKDFSFSRGTQFNWRQLINHITIDDGALNMNNQKIKASIGSMKWNPVQSRLYLRSFSVQPQAAMEEALSAAPYQTDYITVAGKEITLSGISADSIYRVKNIFAEGITLTSARDKRKPFKKIEKMMPGHLIASVKHHFHIGTVAVKNSNVTIYEISAATHKMGSIPLQNLQALITGFTNIPGEADSLTVLASAELLNNRIPHFYYREAYGDSLSNFEAGIYAAQMHLPAYSSITVPLAAVNVEEGKSDTLYASWAGNKHGAIGTMNFHYKGLKVKMLNKHDSAKKSLLLGVENWLANSLVLRKKNDKQSRIFFMRDKNKFIFNYWIKTIMHGMMSSVGVKSNRKYLKLYRKAQQQYELPEE